MRKPIWLLLLLVSASFSGKAQTLSFQDLTRLFDYDRKTALDVKENKVDSEGDVKISDISYASPKGGRVTAFLFTPSGKGPFPAILFGHWGPGNRTEFLPEARLYAEAGVVSLLVDYPWTRPAPWRKSLVNLSDPEADKATYIQAVVDLRRGLDLLESLPIVDSARMAYVGHSYGAQWGAILSAIDRRIKTAVLMGGTPDLKAIWIEYDDPDLVEWRAKSPKGQIENYVKINSPLDAINYIGHVTPTPVLFQFAKHEQYFGETAMSRYIKAASEPHVVKWYNTGHDLNDVQALFDRAKWLQQHIGIKSIYSSVERRLK